jgi:hypothetical protein
MTDIEQDIQEQMAKLERAAFIEKLKQPAAPYVPPPVLPDILGAAATHSTSRTVVVRHASSGR